MTSMYKNDLPIYNEENCFFFALGRNAMYAACQLLQLKAGDEVLTPAFDCEATLQPFRAIGCKLRFFQSDPFTLHVDMDDLKRQITTKTKLIHIINHFGMPQPWDQLLVLRNETGIPTLEDNAFSLFSQINQRPFGTFGDMAIFSLRKDLPLSDGGMLRINNPSYTFNPPSRKTQWFYFTEMNAILNGVKHRLRYNKFPEGLRRLVGRFNHAVERPPPLYSENDNGFPQWPSRDIIGRQFSCDYLRPMSRLARYQLGRLSLRYYADIVNIKRRHYSWLSERLNHMDGIKVLWPDLPEGVVPFCVSLLISSNRDAFLTILRKKYDVMAWPTLSNLVLQRLEDFPDVKLLGKNLLV